MLRVAVFRVEHQKGRVEIAAGGQALLGIEQFLLAVFRSGGNAHDVPDALGVVSFHPLEPDVAEAVGRARVVVHAQAGAVPVGIDGGLAVGDARGRVALFLEVAQTGVLGRVPVGLGEGTALLERPCLLDARALRRRFRVAVHRVGKADRVVGHPGLLTRRHFDDDGARRGAFRGGVHAQRQFRVEVAQCCEQVACIGVGLGQQAVELGSLQIGKPCVPLQIEVALQMPGNAAVLAHDLHLEDQLAFGNLHGALFIMGLLAPIAAQHAAALQCNNDRSQQDPAQCVGKKGKAGRRGLAFHLRNLGTYCSSPTCCRRHPNTPAKVRARPARPSTQARRRHHHRFAGTVGRRQGFAHFSNAGNMGVGKGGEHRAGVNGTAGATDQHPGPILARCCSE